ncbi:DUF397 domain-containing protein [Streptomyces sp. bgisy100]|uniref:DUF397 domain-containing protein n=1 Tax=Streptomyces sp. bgisy100 TaxID=3413783 RepID=UPI003D73026C
MRTTSPRRRRRKRWRRPSRNTRPRSPVRDPKNPDGPALVFRAEAWTSFVRAVKDGELPA